MFSLCFCCETKSQTNLVPNGSFEDTVMCPYAAGQVNFVKHWYLPSSGSSDYFNSCDGTGLFSTPSNNFGYQTPFHGNAYLGFSPFTLNQNYSEYIATKLIHSLEKDRVYYVSYYLSLSEPSKYAINSLGIYFSNSSIISSDDYALDTYTPQIMTTSFIIDKQNWTKVSSSYLATGGEEYITIGNFKLNSNTNTISNDSLGNYSYYFIDSVGVYEKENPLIIPNVFTPNNDKVNDYWSIESLEIIQCEIYNRWGIKVFEKRNNVIIWDGRTSSGIECNDGTYFFVIQTKEKTYKGFIQLMR